MTLERQPQITQIFQGARLDFDYLHHNAPVLDVTDLLERVLRAD